MKKLALAAVLAVLPLSTANAMDVATFLAKAELLEKKGMMALFSSDYKSLKMEVENSGAELDAERVAALKGGKKAAYCPLPNRGLNSDELLTYFRTVSAPRRARMQVKEGLRELLARKYPCR